MQFAAALIEYLITGLVAVVWILVVINGNYEISVDEIKKFKELIIIVSFPVAYILGIYIDVISSFLLRRSKEIHKAFSPQIPTINAFFKHTINFVAGTPKSDPYKNSTNILSYSPPDLARAMEAYVSRDRIARGMALNSLIGFFITYSYLKDNLEISVICLFSFILSIFIWRRLRRLSKTFKSVAIEQLEKNITRHST